MCSPNYKIVQLMDSQTHLRSSHHQKKENSKNLLDINRSQFLSLILINLSIVRTRQTMCHAICLAVYRPL